MRFNEPVSLAQSKGKKQGSSVSTFAGVGFCISSKDASSSERINCSTKDRLFPLDARSCEKGERKKHCNFACVSTGLAGSTICSIAEGI